MHNEKDKARPSVRLRADPRPDRTASRPRALPARPGGAQALRSHVLASDVSAQRRPQPTAHQCGRPRRSSNDNNQHSMRLQDRHDSSGPYLVLTILRCRLCTVCSYVAVAQADTERPSSVITDVSFEAGGVSSCGTRKLRLAARASSPHAHPPLTASALLRRVSLARRWPLLYNHT